MADSADLNYTTFCPHYEASLPPRTFRYHREKYFDEKNGVWEKLDIASSDEDAGEMEFTSEFENPYDSDEPFTDDVRVSDAEDGKLKWRPR